MRSDLNLSFIPFSPRQLLKRSTCLQVQPDSHERVTLPYKVTNSRPRPELEARMLELLNKERLAKGLKALASDPELTAVARKHSADMFHARLLRA
jgi:uncharacterized protein YkwD